MNQADEQYKGQRGFTLIEIIAVLTIIALISAIAIYRVNNVQDTDNASQVEILKSHLRYAQIRSMNTDSCWGIDFNSDKTSYSLFRIEGSNDNNNCTLGSNGSNVTKLIIGESSELISLPAKKSNLIITSAPQVIAFNKYGIPVINGNPAVSNVSITTSAPSPYNSIVVTKNTGFIP